ncbi:MAG: YraN family protein [bacterium]|nr:YraN family protein [bacterium]
MSQLKINEGKLGEDVATEYLRKSGFKIIERNFRLRNGEVDIIAIEEKTKTLVFVEVKTRTSEKFGTPLEAITFWKLRSLTRVAQYYKMTHPNLPDLLRIDAVSVKISGIGKTPTVEHIKNISGL